MPYLPISKLRPKSNGLPKVSIVKFTCARCFIDLLLPDFDRLRCTEDKIKCLRRGQRDSRLLPSVVKQLIYNQWPADNFWLQERGLSDDLFVWEPPRFQKGRSVWLWFHGRLHACYDARWRRDWLNCSHVVRLAQRTHRRTLYLQRFGFPEFISLLHAQCSRVIFGCPGG